SGRDDSEKDKAENQLNSFSVDVGDQNVLCRLGTFVFSVPKDTKSLRIALKDKRGSIVSKQEVAFPATVIRPDAKLCQVCPVAQSGLGINCFGNFDGDSRHVNATFGGKNAVIVAESPRKVVLQTPTNVVGSTEIQLVTGDYVAKAAVNIVKIDVSVQD